MAESAVPLLVIVSVVLQIACAVHVVRSGRQLYWIWILFIGSYLAVIVYLLVAVIPDLRNDPRSRRSPNRSDRLSPCSSHRRSGRVSPPSLSETRGGRRPNRSAYRSRSSRL